MYILSAALTFYISHANSLKDKRQVRRAIIDKARHRFNVAIAEVDTQEMHRVLTIGIAVVSGENAHAQESLDKIIEFMNSFPDAELTGIEQM